MRCAKPRSRYRKFSRFNHAKVVRAPLKSPAAATEPLTPAVAAKADAATQTHSIRIPLPPWHLALIAGWLAGALLALDDGGLEPQLRGADGGEITYAKRPGLSSRSDEREDINDGGKSP